MKHISLIILISFIVSCETSEGLKSGILQKVSHKKFPCGYYVAEFAYDGGRRVSDGNSSSYENTQEVEITQAAYDSLQSYVGKKVVFDYSDRGFTICAPRKVLSKLRISPQN